MVQADWNGAGVLHNYQRNGKAEQKARGRSNGPCVLEHKEENVFL